MAELKGRIWIYPDSAEVHLTGLQREHRAHDVAERSLDVIFVGKGDGIEHRDTDGHLVPELDAVSGERLSVEGELVDDPHDSSSLSEGAATPSDDTVEEAAAAGQGTFLPDPPAEPFESETLSGIDAVKVLVDRRIDQRTTDIEALRKHGDQTAVNMLTGCKIELEDLRRELEWIEVSGLDTTEADQIAGRL